GEHNTINIEASGAQLYLEAEKSRYDSLVPWGDHEWEYHSYKKDIKYRMRLFDAAAQVDAPWQKVGNEYIKMLFTPDTGKKLYLEVEASRVVTGGQVFATFDQAAANVKKHFLDFTAKMPRYPAQYAEAAQTAQYIIWSCIVYKYDRLTRDAIYMSKNYMLNIWSWDNCFNAMFAANVDPKLALDQLLIFADHQDESGAYPDYINNASMAFGCVKPPVHTWAYSRLMERFPLFRQPEVMQEMYDTLSKNIGYWLNFRDGGEGKLPFYNHGNDSGWDNASIFLLGMPVESPDLAAHLIRSCDKLSELALVLGRTADSHYYKQTADTLYKNMMERLYVDGKFVARLNGAIIPNQDSLILRLPIMIAYRFPKEVTQKLVFDLRQNFLCAAGVATESPDSAQYEDDGYWLGPVWAPTTYIVCDALEQCGEHQLAKEIAHNFLHAGTIGGMAENFNAKTCQSQSDPAFTWTSSVYLMLAEQYGFEE
ncbi:MAG: hypothetical protein RR276_07760, partial [Angelakisella sp.]